MNRPEDILLKVREQTSSIILFSSLTGKDSILLTHYCATIFESVISVYMYTVKGLEHVFNYQKFFQSLYSNIQYIHVPHFVVSWHIHNGFMGMRRDPKYKRLQLVDIIAQVRAKTGVEWVCFGMKQADGLKRMFELREFDMNAINWMTHRVYPLTDLKDEQVRRLIDQYGLPKPVRYDNGHSQSVDIVTEAFIGWLYENYPSDLEKVFEQYPDCKHLLYEYISHGSKGIEERKKIKGKKALNKNI